MGLIVLNTDINRNCIIMINPMTIEKWLVLIVKLMKLDKTMKMVMPIEGMTIATRI